MVGDMEDLIYAVVVVRQPHCKTSTTLAKYREAAIKAGIPEVAEFKTRTEAEDALDAMESVADHSLVLTVERRKRFDPRNY